MCAVCESVEFALRKFVSAIFSAKACCHSCSNLCTIKDVTYLSPVFNGATAQQGLAH